MKLQGKIRRDLLHVVSRYILIYCYLLLSNTVPNELKVAYVKLKNIMMHILEIEQRASLLEATTILTQSKFVCMQREWVDTCC
jgi:hypothetical protein